MKSEVILLAISIALCFFSACSDDPSGPGNSYNGTYSFVDENGDSIKITVSGESVSGNIGVMYNGMYYNYHKKIPVSCEVDDNGIADDYYNTTGGNIWNLTTNFTFTEQDVHISYFGDAGIWTVDWSMNLVYDWAITAENMNVSKS
ncbi:hypothetical protein J7L01_06030 [bacterium]|nr:hypothetical protein [bacterium]